MAKKKVSLEDKHNQAYDLFMTTNKTQKDIAKIVDVGDDTLGRWVKDGAWKQEKAARSVTKEKIIANNLVQILNLQEAINKRDNKWPTPVENQTLNMLTSNVNMLSGKSSLPQYIHTFDEFLKFLHKADSDLAKKVADYTLEFVQNKARELSR